MTPPVFETCTASSDVLALLGADPTRLWSFAQAPQGTVAPFAVWQVISGAPENFLGGPPDVDHLTVQFDVYAGDAGTAREVARALRDAVEGVAYVTAWGGEWKDPSSQEFRVSFDVDWFVMR